MEPRHDSVLLHEALMTLHIAPGDTVVDATVGGAGHFGALLSALSGTGTLVGIDADHEAIVRGQKVADASGGTDVHLVEGNFRDLGAILDRLNITSVSKVLFDLGWSGYHLSSGRGFSFRSDEPLMMTYGTPEEGKTAADIVNQASEEALADLFFSLGEERFARPIARGIVSSRKNRRIISTTDLATIVEEAVPSWYRHRRIHAATKTFQALRIAVNDELGALREGLTEAINRLAPHGRVAIITFHSIEDRIVKSMLRDAAHNGSGALVTKKPIAPSDEEAKRNPRARSAKLRVFEKDASPGSVSSRSPLYAYA